MDEKLRLLESVHEYLAAGKLNIMKIAYALYVCSLV